VVDFSLPGALPGGGLLRSNQGQEMDRLDAVRRLSISESICNRVGTQWIVDIWQEGEHKMKVRVSDIVFHRIEIEMSKDLFDDEKFDVVGHVVDEFDRAMRGKK
jgi:hypothetical protein